MLVLREAMSSRVGALSPGQTSLKTPPLQPPTLLLLLLLVLVLLLPAAAAATVVTAAADARRHPLPLGAPICFSFSILKMVADQHLEAQQAASTCATTGGGESICLHTTAARACRRGRGQAAARFDRLLELRVQLSRPCHSAMP